VERLLLRRSRWVTDDGRLCIEEREGLCAIVSVVRGREEARDTLCRETQWERDREEREAQLDSVEASRLSIGLQLRFSVFRFGSSSDGRLRRLL